MPDFLISLLPFAQEGMLAVLPRIALAAFQGWIGLQGFSGELSEPPGAACSHLGIAEIIGDRSCNPGKSQSGEARGSGTQRGLFESGVDPASENMREKNEKKVNQVARQV
jgi:hypothetical protein